MHRFSFVFVALLLVLIPAQAQDLSANLRVAHFSPDAPEVDIYVDGEVAVEALAFPDVTPFLELAAGEYEVAVAPAGTSLDDAVIGPATIDLDEGTFTTVAAVGSLAAETLTVTVFEEDLAAPYEANFARITTVHAIEGAPAVDLYGSNALLVQALRFPSANNDGAFTRDLPAGEIDLEVTVAENRDAVLTRASNVALEAETPYLIAAVGTPENPLLLVRSEEEVLVMPLFQPEDFATEATPEPRTVAVERAAQVRVAHFSPDAPAVDVYVDGEVAVEALEYPVVTDFLELEPGTYSIAVAPAGTSLDDAVIGPLNVAFEEQSVQTIAAVGSVDAGTLTATVIVEDGNPISEDNARVTFIHAVEDAPGVDVYGSNALLVQSLRFPSANSDGGFTREIPAGEINFTITVAENRDAVLASANNIDLEDGVFYIVAAIGTAEEPGLLVVTGDEVIFDPFD